MGLDHSPAIVTDGLVFYHDAANRRSYSGSGTSVFNITGTKTGILTNGVGYTTANQGYFSFDGTNDFIDLSTNLNVGSNFSVFAWVYPGNINQRNAIVGNSYPYTSADGWFLSTATNYLGTSNTFFISVGADSSYRTANNESIITNRWNYMGGTVTNGGGNITLYTGGIAVTSYQGGAMNANTITYNTQDMAIGRRVSTNTEYFIGNIALVKIYNRTLTAQEVLQNYNATKGRYGL
jgi:hypothetical protein